MGNGMGNGMGNRMDSRMTDPKTGKQIRLTSYAACAG
jgi:hypothetical protein